MMDRTNCPNCGAVITGDKCEYCGTVFDFNNKISSLEVELNKAIMKVVMENQQHIMKQEIYNF